MRMEKDWNFDEIIGLVLRNRFKINKIKMLTFDRSTAEQFYAAHKNETFFGPLIEYMTSGPMTALEIEGENAIENVRTLAGVTNPSDARPGTLRYMYGSNITRNAVHASDSPEAAKKELDIVFGGS